MGYIPIFLYLGSFVFLFVMVVNNSIKSKKKQYRQSLAELAEVLKNNSRQFPTMAPLAHPVTLEEAERYYLALKDLAGEEKQQLISQRVRPVLGRTRQRQHWYNNMLKTKPYSMVAGLFGHSPL
ncbi:MAG TPA: hypothetical protein VKX33_10025 [Cyclobacteriaceae bacterium]|nr:hypothetical protein [Cyclobacteriaceae bacterium]